MSAARVMAAVPTSVSTPDPPTAVDAQRVTLFIQIKRRVLHYCHWAFLSPVVTYIKALFIGPNMCWLLK